SRSHSLAAISATVRSRAASTSRNTWPTARSSVVIETHETLRGSPDNVSEYPARAHLQSFRTLRASNLDLSVFMRFARSLTTTSSATRPAGGVDCNQSAMAGFAAAHG